MSKTATNVSVNGKNKHANMPTSKPALRARVYTEKDVLLMKEICSLRDAGLCLRDIRKIIGHKASHQEAILRKRLHGINAEIQRLREHFGIRVARTDRFADQLLLDQGPQHVLEREVLVVMVDRELHGAIKHDF
jgi:DNA-binding transcriptional MerR regulator